LQTEKNLTPTINEEEFINRVAELANKFSYRLYFDDDNDILTILKNNYIFFDELCGYVSSTLY
jgi:hypothetical protein